MVGMRIASPAGAAEGRVARLYTLNTPPPSKFRRTVERESRVGAAFHPSDAFFQCVLVDFCNLKGEEK